MFKIKREKFGKLSKVRLINQKTNELVSIIPKFGANTSQIILNKNQKLYSLIDESKTIATIKDNSQFMGANCKLIPFANRIKDGCYHFHNKTYQLPINEPDRNNSLHGFVFNQPFKVEKIFANSKSAKLTLGFKYNQNFSGYPFKFKVKLVYSLSRLGFKAITKIINLSQTTIPIVDGWHPYFTLNQKIDDLYLQIPSQKKILVDKRLIPTGKYITFNNFSNLTKINKTFFDTGFVVNKRKKPKTLLFSKKHNYTLCLWQETGKNKYNYLQIYTPPLRKSIAIEPMTSNTNAFNNKKGLIVLKPGKFFKASYGVSLI